MATQIRELNPKLNPEDGNGKSLENYIGNCVDLTVIFRRASVPDPKTHRSEGTLLTGENQ